MKHIIVAAILFAPSLAAAEPNEMVIADLGLHVVGGGLQYRSSSHTVIQGAIDLYSPWTKMDNDGRSANDILGAIIRLRPVFYLFDAPAGVWVSPFVQGGIGWGVVGDSRKSGPVAAVGAAVGYSWLFGRVMLSIGAGAQYHYASFEAPDRPTPSFKGVWPHADLVVGYAL